MKKTLAGTNDDGTPHYNYEFDQAPDSGGNVGGVLFTGPVSGTIRLSDGTLYNVTEPVIEHLPGHAGPICHHIEVMHESSGALGPNYKHTCTDFCGAEAVK